MVLDNGIKSMRGKADSGKVDDNAICSYQIQQLKGMCNYALGTSMTTKTAAISRTVRPSSFIKINIWNTLNAKKLDFILIFIDFY